MIVRLSLENDDMEPGETRLLAKLHAGCIILEKTATGVVTLSVPDRSAIELLEGAKLEEVLTN